MACSDSIHRVQTARSGFRPHECGDYQRRTNSPGTSVSVVVRSAAKRLRAERRATMATVVDPPIPSRTDPGRLAAAGCDGHHAQAFANAGGTAPRSRAKGGPSRRSARPRRPSCRASLCEGNRNGGRAIVGPKTRVSAHVRERPGSEISRHGPRTPIGLSCEQFRRQTNYPFCVYHPVVCYCRGGSLTGGPRPRKHGRVGIVVARCALPLRKVAIWSRPPSNEL